MHLNRKQFLRMVGATALATTAATASATNNPWPTRALRLVVPYPPGGSSDIIARSIGPLLSQTLKQPVVIDNKPGANGNLGADWVAQSAADGHTFMLCDLGALAISPSLYPHLPFKLNEDLRGTAMLAYSPHLLAVYPSLPVNNLQELVQLSQRQDLSFAVTATGSAPHLAGVELARATGARWQYVPYKGGSQSIQDTIAGHTQVLMNGMLATYPHVQSGKLKLLGLSKATRMPLAPNVPTLAEQGVPGFETGTWQGVVVPAKTPEAVVQRLHDALVAAIRSPEVRARLTGQGAEIVTMSPEETSRFIRQETARWQQVVQSANLKID